MKVANLTVPSALALCKFKTSGGLFCRQGTFRVGHLPPLTVGLRLSWWFSGATSPQVAFSHFYNRLRALDTTHAADALGLWNKSAL
jgi:hypothetical protein